MEKTLVWVPVDNILVPFEMLSVHWKKVVWSGKLINNSEI